MTTEAGLGRVRLAEINQLDEQAFDLITSISTTDLLQYNRAINGQSLNDVARLFNVPPSRYFAFEEGRLKSGVGELVEPAASLLGMNVDKLMDTLLLSESERKKIIEETGVEFFSQSGSRILKTQKALNRVYAYHSGIPRRDWGKRTEVEIPSFNPNLKLAVVTYANQQPTLTTLVNTARYATAPIRALTQTQSIGNPK